MALRSGLVLLHRPGGEAAVLIGGGVARPEQATRAVLQTADGGVLVKAIQRQADGSFIGEVYGVTPRQRSVALGDLVSFRESQIFTFKPAATESSVQPRHVEPMPVDRAPPAGAPIEGAHEVTCLECGAILNFVPTPDDSTLAPRKLRVTCRKCGRINDIAEAEAASRRRWSA